MSKTVYLVSAVRTPLGSFNGSLAAVSATQLGAAAIKGALEKAGISPDMVNEVFMGNVISANLGQAPARQAAMYAGIPNSVPCTTVNKVCASGMKAIMFAAQSIMLGHNDIVVAGGMESMSNIPFYLDKARFQGYGYGHGTLIDGLVRDGLEDVYDKKAMGVYADATAEKYAITREEQDEFAILSYKRSAASTEKGLFKDEIVPVSIPQRKGDPIVVSQDEEYKRVDFSKVPTLRAVFTPNGSVTAANASTINDGAAACILVSEETMVRLSLEPIARIVSFADAAHEPAWFTTAPTLAAPIALKRAGLSQNDIDFYEVNEAFSVVTLAFNKVLGIDVNRVNVNGGAVSLGHPLGCSGARIVGALSHILHQNNGKYGMAAICNGGGGASALIVEKV
ncbi:acetyl-CoA C-acyltransferase [Hugenholtzia roseola]|uniref:acetyl-CoA C-acyltransferase n=1 Tax=Hugenholtzia roseola TaxID=1002 RepID=UPI0003F74057|nr:acetyl-CoA C-acyltransferase [Hugenholtzia roseola]